VKILFLSHSPNNPNGGASRIYHMLTDGLRKRGHSVTTLHFEDFHPPRSQLPSLLVLRLAMPQWISHQAAKRDLLSFDVIMSSSGMAYPIFKRLQSLKKRPVLINHCHGSPIYDFASNLAEDRMGHCKVSLKYRTVTGPFQLRWFVKGMLWSDLTVVQNIRDLGEAQSNPRCRAALIPAAVHPELLEASKVLHPVSARNPSKILWFGKWEGKKGAYYVPDAFRRVRQQRPDATLTLWGTGKSASELLAKFDPADREAVEVVPHINLSEQIERYKSFSIFLFPSITEGFGLALPEAMSFGLAAVTTQAGFGGDHLEDGTNARVVYPSSPHLARAILGLIEDDELRWRLATAGREIARAFTLERMLTAYEKAFTEAQNYRASEILATSGRTATDL
jgi:glycosyltransferase involved in cell wall biosynthesis